MTTSGSARPVPALDPSPRPIDLLAPALWLALVLLYFWVWIASSSSPNVVLTSVYWPYAIGQSGIVAAVLLVVAAWRRRRFAILALGTLAGAVVLFLQLSVLPLDLYACSEWVRVARERGVFTLW